MKKLIRIFLALTLLYVAVGCKNDNENILKISGFFTPSYLLANRSGHIVSIVHEPSCIQMPDSLVLKNGEEFTLHTERDYYGTISLGARFFDKELIYYDGRYMLDLESLPKDRDFRSRSLDLYRTQTIPHIHVFTLTIEDYYHAVENGTDLGESNP